MFHSETGRALEAQTGLDLRPGVAPELTSRARETQEGETGQSGKSTRKLCELPNGNFPLTTIGHGSPLDPQLDERPGVRKDGYQMRQRSVSERTIGDPALHPKAFANAGMFETGPSVRNCPSGCSVVLIRSRAASER